MTCFRGYHHLSLSTELVREEYFILLSVTRVKDGIGGCVFHLVQAPDQGVSTKRKKQAYIQDLIQAVSPVVILAAAPVPGQR